MNTPSKLPGRLVAVSLLLALAATTMAQAQTIRAVTETTPYTYLHDGKPAGAATELVELSLQRAGLTDYRINVYPWARSYDMALKEPNVLIFVMARTPAREAMFKWAGEFLRVQYHLYKLKDRTDIVVRSLDDARRYSVGVIRDDVRHQYLQGKGFGKLLVSGQNVDLFRRLINGQVQLAPLPEEGVAQLCVETRFDCARLERVFTLDEITSSMQMAYSLATPDAVVERTRAAFEKLRAEGVVKRTMERPLP